jgi:hypothetical protein
MFKNLIKQIKILKLIKLIFCLMNKLAIIHSFINHMLIKII